MSDSTLDEKIALEVSLPQPAALSVAVPPAERVRRAARSDCPPLVLQQLARDPDIIVRATVALNGRCDAEVDAILAGDDDERVRALLGSRIARLLAGLHDDERDAATAHVHATLRRLTLDQAIRVRAAIADELAGMETAPRDVILQLANDAASEVSDRVIRLSPLLSDADLLAILAMPGTPRAAESVANRERLSAAVADVIVQQADAPAIRALLSNQSACIREATLDTLIGRAPDHIDWHAPLVRRPSLSAHAVWALSEFITADLLHILVHRADLDAERLEIVRERLETRAKTGDEALMEQARRLQSAGTLDETSLLDAARAGDTRLLLALLAVSSGLTLLKVERALELRSAKALVSVVWRSGFSMTLAADIQTSLSQFGPDSIIRPDGHGNFPMTHDEMRWHLELMNGTEPQSENVPPVR